MVRKIVWSFKAQQQRKDILEYWLNRTKSNSYSRKLNELFLEAIELIKNHPLTGKLTDDQSARIKIVRDYFIIYEYSKSQIQILSIWDSRQNPEKLKDLLE
jgi:addiction module RelE/StbE family toxin